MPELEVEEAPAVVEVVVSPVKGKAPKTPVSSKTQTAAPASVKPVALSPPPPTSAFSEDESFAIDGEGSALRPPELILPEMSESPYPKSSSIGLVRTIPQSYLFLKSLNFEAVTKLREGDDTEVNAAAAAAAIAEIQIDSNPESTTPATSSAPALASAPAPTAKKQLNRDGVEIDATLASIFKCISSFSGSFSPSPNPPPLDSDGNAEENHVRPPTSTPFSWEAIYPQNADRKPVYNPSGKYVVKVFLAGKWRMIEVDDSIPLDATGARIKSDAFVNDDDNDSEVNETASFSAFAFHVLTGWLPQAILSEVDVFVLDSLGGQFSAIHNYVVNEPNLVDADAAPVVEETPMKKLAQILSPSKHKKRKNKKAPPPHPVEIENASRISHNKINSIKAKLMESRPGVSVVVFNDSLQNLVILPILAIMNDGRNAVTRASRFTFSPRFSYSPSSSQIGSVPLSPMSMSAQSAASTKHHSPQVLLSWDCKKPTHTPYNEMNAIPSIPHAPNPQMSWMSASDLADADCRIVHLSTLTSASNSASHSAVWSVSLPSASSTYTNNDLEEEQDRVDLKPTKGLKGGATAAAAVSPPSDMPVGDLTKPYRRPINIAPTFLRVDTAAIQPKRFAPAGPPRLIIAGPPAGGKGTQCEFIKERYGVVHLSTGDMLRAAVAAGTDLGLITKECMEKGELVSDDVITSVVLDRLKEEDCKTKGWLLDGFPRTKVQADALVSAYSDESSGILPADAFLLLDVPSETLVERVSGRRSDPVTGKIYHMTFSPPGDDDEEVLERLVQRSDDTEEAIAVRIETFNENTSGVLTSFDSKIMRKIDGSGDKDPICERVLFNISDIVDPPKVDAKLHLCLSANAHVFAQEENEEGGENEGDGEEKKDPEIAGVEEGEEEEVRKKVSQTTLPAYSRNSVITIEDYYDAAIKHVAVIPTSNSLGVVDVIVPVCVEDSGLLVVSFSTPFGATLSMNGDAPVEIGSAEQVFGDDAKRHVSEEEGECKAVCAGENVVFMRRTISSENDDVSCDFFLHVGISSSITLYKMDNDSGETSRLPSLSLKKCGIKGGSKGLTLIAVLNDKKFDTPKFAWSKI